jgi:hypothetical protein
MSGLTYGLFVRGQYRAGDNMMKRFDEVKAQVRLADRLGFADLLTGMHYAAAPLQQYQLIPLLARCWRKPSGCGSSPESSCCRCTSRSISPSSWRRST